MGHVANVGWGSPYPPHSPHIPPTLPIYPHFPPAPPPHPPPLPPRPTDPMEPPLPRPPDGDRRRKRRELDARRSKCRIRLGGHLEQWCRLKEQLGFALHSQLAKFLLDRSRKPPPESPNTSRVGLGGAVAAHGSSLCRYSSQGCVVSRGRNRLCLGDPTLVLRCVVLNPKHSCSEGSHCRMRCGVRHGVASHSVP